MGAPPLSAGGVQFSRAPVHWLVTVKRWGGDGGLALIVVDVVVVGGRVVEVVVVGGLVVDVVVVGRVVVVVVDDVVVVGGLVVVVVVDVDVVVVGRVVVVGGRVVDVVVVGGRVVDVVVVDVGGQLMLPPASCVGGPSPAAFTAVTR
jgi:hypothetical protein